MNVETAGGSRASVLRFEDDLVWMSQDGGRVEPSQDHRFCRLQIDYVTPLPDDIGLIADAFMLETDSGTLIDPVGERYNDEELQGRFGDALPAEEKISGYVYFEVPSEATVTAAVFDTGGEDTPEEARLLLRWTIQRRPIEAADVNQVAVVTSPPMLTLTDESVDSNFPFSGSEFSLGIVRNRGQTRYVIQDSIGQIVHDFPYASDGWRWAWAKFAKLEPSATSPSRAESLDAQSSGHSRDMTQLPTPPQPSRRSQLAPRHTSKKSGPSVGVIIGVIVFVGWFIVSGASCWLTDANGEPAFLPWLHNLMEPLGFC
jgi:hypothetical protein